MSHDTSRETHHQPTADRTRLPSVPAWAFWVPVLALAAAPDTLLTHQGLSSGQFVELNPVYAGLVATLGVQHGLVVAYAVAVLGPIAIAEMAALGWARYDMLRPYRHHLRHGLYGFAVGLNLLAAQHNAALLGGALV